MVATQVHQHMNRHRRFALHVIAVASRTIANTRWPLSSLLPAVIIAIAVVAAGPVRGDAQSNATVDLTSNEARTCLTCHADLVQHFANNPHNHPTSALGNGGAVCANCHGPGKAHIESGGDKSKIVDPSVGQVNGMCLGCHEGRHPAFAYSAHGKGNVSCIGCHSIHAASAAKYLLKAPEPQLCFQCHANVKSQFSLPYRHKVNEGLITCSDCHDAHSARDKEPAGYSKKQDEICTNCHTKIAGPFVFEHPVVKTEGCTACHLPHGSPNMHLLSRANVNTICLFCHMPSFNSSTESDIAIEKIHTAQYKSCVSCHSDVHGSNASQVFLKQK